jgi:hypothetical protein
MSTTAATLHFCDASIRDLLLKFDGSGAREYGEKSSIY